MTLVDLTEKSICWLRNVSEPDHQLEGTYMTEYCGGEARNNSAAQCNTDLGGTG